MEIKQLINLGLDENVANQVYIGIQKYVEEKLQKQKEESQNEILEIKLNMAIERQLFMAGAKNIKATKALIDIEKLDKVNIDEKAIRKLINELKNNIETSFLFFEPKDDKLKGFKPLESNVNLNNNRALTYEELCKYYENGLF